MSDVAQRIQIFGQRCSGTNFLEKLLLANFENIKIVHYYGFKHLWNTRLLKPVNPADQIKIIIIVRDPYDWLRSVYREPHHCPQLLGLSFKEFIKAPWAAYYSSDWNHYNRDVRLKTIQEDNSIEVFDDVLECRNAKMNMLKNLKHEFKGIVVVKYEDLRDRTELTLQDIQKNTGIKRKNNFTQIFSYKNSGKSFKKKKYLHLSKSIVSYINSRINWENEASFEYYSKEKVRGTLINYHRIQFLIKQWYYENLAK